MLRDFEVEALKKIIQKKQEESLVNTRKIEEIKHKIESGEFDILHKENPHFQKTCLELANNLLKSEEEKFGPLFAKTDFQKACLSSKAVD